MKHFKMASKRQKIDIRKYGDLKNSEIGKKATVLFSFIYFCFFEKEMSCKVKKIVGKYFFFSDGKEKKLET